MIRIRPATAADAEALARLAESTFRDTFGAANTAEDMELHCRSSYGAAIQAREISDPSGLTLLGEEGPELIGYAQLRWTAPPRGVSGELPGEIRRFYVASGWHGRGVAQELMRACLDALRARGCDVVWLGVWERNPRALAFYRKLGFVEVGDQIFRLGADPQRDLVLARPLPPELEGEEGSR